MRCLSVGSRVLLLSLKCRTRCGDWSKCIFEIDLRIDFLPNLRQTQNAVEQMKRNCFVFNGTRAEVCFGITHQSDVEKEKNVFEKRKRGKSSVGILVIIMVVTFLIEFRLPNFSPTAPTERDWKTAHEQRVINRFPSDFSLHLPGTLKNCWKFKLRL